MHFQLRWLFGHRRDGRWGFRSLPSYSIIDWRRDDIDADRLTYRPSWRTAVRRSMLTALAAALLALMCWTAGVPWQPDWQAAPANQLVEPPGAVEFQDRPGDDVPLEHGQRRRGARRQRAARPLIIAVLEPIFHAAHWTAFVGLVAAGGLPLFLVPWERLTIRRGADGELVVCRRRLLTRTRAWSAGAFGGAVCEAVERVHRRRGGRRESDWVWVVRLVPHHTGGMIPWPLHVDDPVVEFHVGHQCEAPHDAHRPPRRVRSFLKHVLRLAGVSDVQYAVLPDLRPTGSGRGFPFPAERRIVTYSSEPIVESAVYRSLDEIPDALRDEVRRLLAEGRTGEEVVRESVRITVRDADGNERTYTSLEELPPELRQRHEQALRRARRKRRP